MKQRKAVIREVKTYVVDLYEDNKLLEERPLYGHSLRYAEDCAENWEMGIFDVKGNEDS